MAEQNNNFKPVQSPANILIEQLNKLTLGDWSKILIVVLLAGFAVYRCVLPFRAEYVFREAYNAEAQNNIPVAIEKYKKTMVLAPWETYYFVQLGKIYENQARTATVKEEKIKYIKLAENVYNVCLAISPTNPWYVNRMGEVYELYAQVADTPDQAVALRKKRDATIIQAASLDPNNALFQLSIAYLYHQKKDYATAIKKYEHVLDIDDTMGEAYFNLADIYRQKGLVNKQIEMYQKIIEKKPGFKNAHLQLGKIYETRGRLDDAIREYIAEVNLDKNNEVAFQILGMALYKKGDWTNMEKAYRRLTILDPNNPDYYVYKAQAEAKLLLWNEAISDMESAVALRPDDQRYKGTLNTLKRFRSGSAPQAIPVSTPPVSMPQQ